MSLNSTVLLFLAAIFPSCFGQEVGTAMAVAMVLLVLLYEKKDFSGTGFSFKKIGFSGPELLLKKI